MIKNTTLGIIAFLVFSWGTISAQEITTVNSSTTNCQCDSINVSFTVTTAFTVGNNFTVELSTAAGTFPGQTIEVNSLTADTVGNYNMQAFIPCATVAGTTYSIRVLGDLPVTVSSDTLENVTINVKPTTSAVTVPWPGMGAPSTSLAAGDSIMLSAVDTVVPGWTYQWQKQNPINSGTWTNIVGETNVWLEVNNTHIAALDTANFRVIVDNGNCTDTTNLIQIDYSIPVAVDEIVNVNTSTQNCQCDTITVLFDVVVPLNVGNSFRVEMSTAAGTFPGQFIEIAPLLGFNIGSYQMDAIVPCTSSQGVYSIRVTGDNPVTASQPVNNIIVGALPNTDITIHGTYSYGLGQRFCEGDTAYLVGPVPPVGETHQYKWLSSGVIIPGETDDTLMVLTSGIYSVSVTRGLCEDVSNDTIVNAYTPPAFIWHNSDPSIQVVSNVGFDSIQMCKGTVATLNAPIPFGTDIYRYQWYMDTLDPFGNPVKYALPADTNQTLLMDSAGVFYVSVTAFPGGCIDTSESFTVFIDTIPTTSIVALSAVNLCYEDSVIISATDTVTYPDWKYQWQIEYPIGSGMWLDSPVDTIPWVQIDTMKIPNADTVNLRLRTSTLTCEFFTNQMQVIFIPDPVFTFFPSDSVSICLDDSIYVSVQGNALSYSWENGQINPGIWVHPIDAPSLWVEATGVNGCTSYDTLKIGVFQSSALISPASIEVGPGEYANFTGSGGTNYYWFSDIPADFNDRTDSVVSILPTGDTTAVILRITGAFGCIDYDTAYVYVVDTEVVDPDDKFSDVQNVITPNNDGKNDLFDLSTVLGTEICGLSILDRWGREVYQKDGYDNTWNGTTTAGEDLPDGTYYFIIQCDNSVKYKGAITIIRNDNK